MARGKYSMVQNQLDRAIKGVLELDERCARRVLERRVGYLIRAAQNASRGFTELRKQLREPASTHRVVGETTYTRDADRLGDAREDE